MEGSVETVPAQLSHLPSTEHALLLNRFKFLNLVQRIAAADVAEMIDTVGLEALTFKGTIEKLPSGWLSGSGQSKREQVQGTVALSKGGGRRGGGVQQTRGHPAGDERGKKAQRPRFSSPTKEREFVNRLARPRNQRNPFGDEWRRYPHERTIPDDIRATEVAAAESSASRRWGEGRPSVQKSAVRPNNDEGDLYSDDVVVVESCDDRLLQHNDTMRKAAWGPYLLSDQEGPACAAGDKDRKNNGEGSTRSFVDLSQNNAPEGASLLSVGKAEDLGTTSIPPDAIRAKNQSLPPKGKLPAFDAVAPQAAISARRNRTSFAPKAKPQAAPDVQRVPLDVIHKVSSLLADKHAAEPLQQPPPPQGPPSGAQNPTQGDTVSIYGSNFRGSGSQIRIPSSPRSLNSKKEIEVAGVAPKRVMDDTLVELTSCVERMLQDHRKVLEGILKDERPAPDDPPELVRRPEKGGRGGVADEGINMTGHKPPTKGIGAPLKGSDAISGSTMGRINDLLEDLSEEEDELLLISHIQRKVGAMGREIENIEGRDKQLHDSLGADDGELRQTAERDAGSRDTGRRIAFADTAPPGVNRGRRRGEIPRAIVERIRSFQKENHEYIQYCEKLWNTSRVTEQVFAHRLTESLLDDALREVFDEVGGILDTYVEGLMHHELQ